MTNLFLSVVGISVSISLMVAVLILLTAFLNKRYAAKWKYMIWIFLALWLLVPFTGAAGQAVRLPQMKTQTKPQSEEKHTDAPAGAATAPGRVIVEIPAQMTAPIMVQSRKSSVRITLLDIVAFVWMAGSLIFISMHLISYLHYKRQVMKRGTMIEDTRILRQMSELKRELHIRRAIQIVEYSGAGSPMIIGFLKTVLVLPGEQYSPEELFFILKHELVHLKRGDTCFKLLFMIANAVHWFNPLIWIMQREAVVDMELSCDERVTQGTDYAVRKAYTETLLSMLHKQCTKKTVLSTQFYGGKKILKKRFKNILIKRGKKNGISILICAAVLTISLGTRVVCAIAKEDAGDTPDRQWNGDIRFKSAGSPSADNDALTPGGTEDQAPGGTGDQAPGGTGDQAPGGTGDQGTEDQTPGGTGNQAPGGTGDQTPGESEDADMQVGQMPADAPSADHNTPENTTVFTFLKEGETEQKQAVLVTGDGYSLYLPDDEWQQSDSDLWTAVVNEQVRLWITHFEDTTIQDREHELIDNGYAAGQNHNLWKQEGDLLYKVGLKEFEKDVWCVFYCYPVVAEEGWGRELPVIADTFAVSVSADDGQS